MSVMDLRDRRLAAFNGLLRQYAGHRCSLIIGDYNIAKHWGVLDWDARTKTGLFITGDIEIAFPLDRIISIKLSKNKGLDVVITSGV